MKETVQRFRKRTGLDYAPPPFLSDRARALGQRDSCPTLFRFPGPIGLHNYMNQGSVVLGPVGSPYTWYSTADSDWFSKAPSLFGAVAILEPLRLNPCQLDHGSYLAASELPPDPDLHLWVPPDSIFNGPNWDRMANSATVLEAIGTAYESARQSALTSLAAYLEELSALKKAGAPGPDKPWCELSRRRRRDILKRSGVTPLWTGTVA